MGVKIEKRVERFLKRVTKKAIKRWKKRKEARKRAAERSQAQRRRQTGRTTSRRAGPAAARPRPKAATPRTRRPTHITHAPETRPAPDSGMTGGGKSQSVDTSATPAASTRAANPLNPVRQYERWATQTNANRAASLKEKAELDRKNREAIAETRRLNAERRAEKKRAKEERAAAKLAAAEARHTKTQEKPTVIPPRKGLPEPAVVRRRPAPQPTAQPQATPGRPAAAPPAAVLCGHRTDKGGSCTHPVVGDHCSAGHTPSNKPKKAPAPSRPQPPRAPRVVVSDGNVAIGGRNAFGRDGTVVSSHTDDNWNRPEWSDDAWKKNRPTTPGSDACSAGGRVVFSDGDAAGGKKRT